MTIGSDDLFTHGFRDMSSSTFAVYQNPQHIGFYKHPLRRQPYGAYNMVADEVRVSVEAVIPPTFFNVPEEAAASFSTELGNILKRPALDPPPPPIVRSNIEQDIYRKADQLRTQFPDFARTVKTVTEWSMLYHYFDGQDLQAEGRLQLKTFGGDVEMLI